MPWNNKNARKKNPRWRIEESKYLRLSQVAKLRRYCLKARDVALAEKKYAPARDWFMVELGLFSGLRVSEMVNLKVEDLKLKDEEFSLTVRSGKGGKPRVVYLGPEFRQVCLYFLRWKAACGQITGRLLTNKSGESLTKRALQKAFKRCLEGAGISAKYGIHCLRHTYATHLYRASGYNLRLVQQQLGHSSIRTTQVYADLLQEDMQRAVKRLYMQH